MNLDPNEEELSYNVPLPPEPLPINYYTIFSSLREIFPDQAFVILSAIKRIIVIKKEDQIQGFSTMGITRTGVLIIDENFWNTYMWDLDSLNTVLMHELMHYVLGDVFNLKTEADSPDFELLNQADLIAMDSRINAYICVTRPDIYPEKFLTTFYNQEAMDGDFLIKLLRPGSNFDTTSTDEVTLSKFHELFYNSYDCENHSDLSKEVLKILKKRGKSGKKGKKLRIKLLGGHKDGGSEITEEDIKNAESIEIDMSGITPEQLKEMQDKANQEGKEGDPKDSKDPKDPDQDSPSQKIKEAIIDYLSQNSSRGAGKSAKINNVLLNQCLHITEKFDLSRFKKLAFDNIFHNVRSQAKVKIGTWSSAPYIPKRPSVSDTIMLAAGIPVMLFKHRKYATRIDKNLLPIYLDVSGSTNAFLPEIIRLIANVSDQLDYVWGFSNFVAKHTTKDLQDGKIKTSGGTDFDCVIEHALENEYKHIVVITDGDAYTQYRKDQLKFESVVTILFGYANKQNFFSEQYGNTHMIDEVKI